MIVNHKISKVKAGDHILVYTNKSGLVQIIKINGVYYKNMGHDNSFDKMMFIAEESANEYIKSKGLHIINILPGLTIDEELQRRKK